MKLALPLNAGQSVLSGKRFAKLGPWAAAFVAISISTGCRPPAETTAILAPPNVVFSPAKTEEIVDYDEFVGRTESSETVEVRARVSGFIRTIDYEDGAFVKANDLLATIEPDEYAAIHEQSLARITLAESQLDYSESVLARSKKLLEGSAISREEFDQNEATVSQSEAAVVVAKADAARTALDLKYTEIRAPIDGRIDRALVTPGNLVTGGLGSGTLLTRIVKDSPIYAYFDVDEASILRYVRKDNATSKPTAGEPATLREMKIPCELRLSDEDDYPHVGVLDFLETRIDKQTGTIQMRGVFENKDRLLRSGMFVRARIPTSAPYTAVLIPEMAIGTDQSYKFAYVINEQNEAVRRNLTLGGSRDMMRIVRDGIKAGENVIVRGVQRVRPGMKVAPVAEGNAS
jgi:RND family efflux transporter MFP subunit